MQDLGASQLDYKLDPTEGRLLTAPSREARGGTNHYWPAGEEWDILDMLFTVRISVRSLTSQSHSSYGNDAVDDGAIM